VGVEQCDDGNTTNGDGCSATCTGEGCVIAATMSCNLSVNGDTTGGPDTTDQWACFTLQTTGPERVYAFTAASDGLLQADLTGLNADLDLMVMTAVGGACAASDSAACIPNGRSTSGGTSSERVEWMATLGTTYYIVVDGYSGAQSSFTLRVGTADSHIILSEIGAAEYDFVELRNLSACPMELSSYVVRHRPDCQTGSGFYQDGPGYVNISFPPGSIAGAGGGTFRAFENPFPYELFENEMMLEWALCDFSDGNGYTLLCKGDCDVTSCDNVLDYVRRRNDADPGGPSCATFTPAPVSTSGVADTHSVTRVDAQGMPKTWLQADWGIEPISDLEM
jgi:hypothetical protein